MEKESFWRKITSDRRSAAIFLTAVCFAMLAVAGVIIFKIASSMRGNVSKETTASLLNDVSAAPVSAPAPAPESNSAAPAKEEENTMRELEELLRAQISDYDGDWTIYVQNLDTGEKMSINSRPIYAASLIKLFCAGAIYNAVEDGNLREDEVKDLMEPMIVDSDNFCFDELVQLLPDDYITGWCEEQDYWDTQQNHCIASDWAYQVLRTAAQDNMTSVDDVGEFLASLYRGECVSEKASKKIIKLLKKQKSRSKIPAGLPKGVVCGNKTGETDYTNHDAAIVWSDGCDYVIAVMGDCPGFAWNCNGYVVAISRTVYEYFNP